MSSHFDTSAARYERRRARWVRNHRFFPKSRHHAWWLLHNCVSHPWLGVSPSERAIQFHDWTSMHLNQRGEVRPSSTPVIPDRRAWVWHNVAGHLAIGLLPVDAAFRFHDRGAEAMAVPDWV